MQKKTASSPFFPSGLAENTFSLLDQCQRQVADIPPEQLLDRAAKHLAAAYRAHACNGVVNVQVAQAIHDIFKVVATRL